MNFDVRYSFFDIGYSRLVQPAILSRIVTKDDAKGHGDVFTIYKKQTSLRQQTQLKSINVSDTAEKSRKKVPYTVDSPVDSPGDLAGIVAVWELPDAIRAAIVAIVMTSKGQ